MEQALLQQYRQIIARMCDALDEMIALEQQKRKTLLAEDGDALEALLPKCQAAAMGLESLEKKRVALQTQLGAADKTVEELLSMMEPEQAEALRPDIAQLQQKADSLRVHNRASVDIAQHNLRIIERIVRRMDAHSEASSLYRADGKKTGGRVQGNAYEERI